MMERRPKIIQSSPLTLQGSHTSPLIMIMGLLLILLLHGSLIACTLRTTHQPGTSTRAGIDLHLGQKPKLGGRYTDITLSFTYHILSLPCLSVFLFLSFSLLFMFYFCFPKHKNTKNISVVSLCLSL